MGRMGYEFVSRRCSCVLRKLAISTIKMMGARTGMYLAYFLLVFFPFPAGWYSWHSHPAKKLKKWKTLYQNWS